MPLIRSIPSAESVAAGGIRSFVDALEAAPDIEPHSLMVLRHGRVIAESWWAPYGPDRVQLLYSLSKSFTSAALGLAIDEDLVSLDDTVLSHFPHLDAEVTDARSRLTLVRHIAAMASGHDRDLVHEAEAMDAADPVRGLLTIPPDREPGRLFAYNQPCAYAIAGIVQARSGQSLTEYLRPRLLEPLGIDHTSWLRDGSGRELGYSGLHAPPGQSPRWDSCTSTAVGGAGIACCPRSGSPRRHVSRSRTPTSRTWTGGRDTGSSSGWRGTAIAATAPTGSSASCFRSTMRCSP